MSLRAAFEQQARACDILESPFMAQLMGILATDWPEDSAIGRQFATYDGELGPDGHSLPLRMAAGLHALVLNGKNRDLAAAYPPAKVKDPVLREAVLAAVEKHGAFLCDWTKSPPQTNEVRRSAALIAGARVAVQHFDLPIRLSELGTSGGLNMMWDHYALEIRGRRFGPDMPALILTPEWTGALPPTRKPFIAGRAGVDLNPLDPTRGDHLLRLTAYLWPDQPDRLTMTRAAASVATNALSKDDAIHWLAPRLHSAPQGQLHMIQHTIAWQYFPADVQARGRALIEAAGAQATANRPLAWLSMESDGAAAPGAALHLRLWPGDLRLELGRADFHGRWIDWTYQG